MPISDTPILSMLRTRMQWHQERQKVLAQNVANADTPNYKARDLAAPDFQRALGRQAALTLARTDAAHIGGGGGGGSQFQVERGAANESRPTGNAVNLEDEMIKVAANQMDYQAAASLYSRSLGLLKTALGKR
ncbi:MAG TPA: flagellar basal body rod protein FlgB [Xanthobacteraceae bacterium]